MTLASCSAQKTDKSPIPGAYDVIIVPGIPYEKGWDGDETMRLRVLWSYYLYSKGITKNIIYSGSAVHSPYIEAEVMAMYAEALGIPKENIFTETKAEHSTENLVYGFKLAKEKGFTHIALASESFQTSMLKTFAWDYHLKIHFIPLNPDVLRVYDGVNPGIDPSKAHVNNFRSLTERDNFFKRISGTIGLGLINN